MLVAAGFPAERIIVLPHQAPPVAVPTGPVRTPLRIGFLGMLQNHKGAHVLVDAIRRIPADLECEVVIRGDLAADPAYVSQLRRGAQGERRIRIVDQVPYRQFGVALGEIDVLVIPSIWAENAPLVLLSALQAGRYVVASDVPGLTHAIDCPGRGRLFPAGDAAALAQTLTDLLRDSAPVRAARTHPPSSGRFPGYVDALESVYRDAVVTDRTAGSQPAAGIPA
jgi:glycosyltransferase involved in cell wall biosynthesis